MALDFKSFFNRLRIKNAVNSTKQLDLTVSNGATANTTTEIVASQTANRTITLPDVSGTLVATSSPLSPSSVVITDVSGALASSVVSSTELASLDGITGVVENRLDSLETNSVTSASNLGTGEGSFASKNGTDLRFKSLKAGTNVTLSSDANEITINAAAASGANTTLSNLTSPTSINQHLVPDITNTKTLGSSTKEFSKGYINQLNSVTDDSLVVDINSRRLYSSTQYMLDWSGLNIVSNTNLDMGNFNINNVLVPSSNDQAVNKLYSDTNLGGFTFDQSAASINDVVTWDGTKYILAPNGSAGEVNTASNLGTGEGVFVSKVGTDLQFKSLKAGTNVTLSSTGTEITIDVSGSSGANTTLSNLTSPTAINQDLTFNKTSPKIISSSTQPISVTTPDQLGSTGIVSLTTGNSSTSGSSGNIVIQTGSGAGSASSGDISITTGASGTTRGEIRLSARSIRMPGNSADPTSPVAGDVYYNSSTNKLRLYNGTSWVDLN